MAGRYRSKDGIKLHSLSIPADPSDIDFDDFIKGGHFYQGEEIYILAHRPGIGKTHNVKQYIKKKIQDDKDFKFFYFTDRHEAILEHTKDLENGTYSHWEGFNRICERPGMKTLYNFHLKTKDICNNCKKKCSIYLSQFNNTSRVFTVFDFLSSKDFKDNLPDIIFLDEVIKQFKLYSADINDAKTLLESMKRDDLVELLEMKDFTLFIDRIDIDKFSTDYKNYVLNLAENKTKNEEELALVEKFNIFDFYKYVRWESIYGYGLKSYAVPSLYYDVFEAVTKGVPAVFMDATFNQYFFCYLLECYNGESKYIGKKNFTNLQVRGFKLSYSDIQKESIIYRMRPEHVMPKTSFTTPKNWEHTKDWLSRHMKAIMTIFGINQVGIITFKDLGDFPKAVGYPVEFYGNLRGLNILKDKPVLVLIGTYLPMPPSWHSSFKDDKSENEGFDELLCKYFYLDVNEKNLVSGKVEAPAGVSVNYDYKLATPYAYKYIGETGKTLGTAGDEIAKRPAEALTTLFWYDEIYQAFYRNRALLNDKIIFAYCWFPEPNATIYTTDQKGRIEGSIMGKLQLFDHDIRKECFIDKIENDWVNAFFEMLPEFEKSGLAEEFINDVIYNPKIQSGELQKKYKTHKEDGGAHTIPITKVKQGLKEFCKIAKRVKEFSPVEKVKK